MNFKNPSKEKRKKEKKKKKAMFGYEKFEKNK